MERSRSAAWVALLVAILAAGAWWLLGGLPWAVNGFRLSALSPGDATFSGVGDARLPLPLTVASMPLLIASTAIGGVCAGLLPVAVTHVPRRLAIVEVWAVVLVAAGIATALSAAQVRDASATGFAADSRVLDGLALVVIISTVVGLALATVAITWHGATSVAAALVAGLVPTWVHALLAAGAGAGDALARHVGEVLVGIVLAAGLVVSVRRTRTAVLGWPVALAVLWLTGPVITAATYLTGLLRPGSGLPDSLPDHLDAAWRVFGEAIRHTHPAYVPVVLALVVGVLAAIHLARAPKG